MFNVEVDMSDLIDLQKYLESGEFVRSMNAAGLSFASMAIVLETLNNRINELLAQFDSKDEEE